MARKRRRNQGPHNSNNEQKPQGKVDVSSVPSVEVLPPQENALDVQIPARAALPAAANRTEAEANNTQPQNWREGFTERLKKYSWRATGIYLWGQIVTNVLGLNGQVDRLKEIFTATLVEFLSGIGGTPVNPNFLSPVLKVGWILLITGFKPLFLLGLFTYVGIFPVLVLIYFGYSYYKYRSKKKAKAPNGGEAQSTVNPPAEDVGSKKTSEKPRMPWLTISGFVLLSWLLVFGDAASKRVVIIGTVVAGIFFLVLVSRVFIRSRPLNDNRFAPFSWLVKLRDLIAVTYENKETQDVDIDTRSEAKSASYIYRFARKMSWQVAKRLRGRDAQDKISLIVLAEFIVSLVMVGASSILFWALAIKTINPTSLSLSSCLNLSASYFLPGLQAPESPIPLPMWASIGPATTAWILFVLYIGPAGNLLPDRQLAYMKRVAESYVLYRNLIFNLGKRVRLLKRLSKELPEK
jgi:hypothetical protein